MPIFAQACAYTYILIARHRLSTSRLNDCVVQDYEVQAMTRRNRTTIRHRLVEREHDSCPDVIERMIRVIMKRKRKR